MIPLQIDINPNYAVSTTVLRDKIEYRCPVYSTEFDVDLVHFDLLDLTGVDAAPNFHLFNSYLDENTSEIMNLDGDFDVISKFKFKKSIAFKAKIKRTSFQPTIILE